jgi:hypothetical protein
VLFVRELGGDQRYGAVWASTWASEAAAASLALGMTALYQADFPDEAAPNLGVEHADDGVAEEPVWIEQRDNQVLVMRNVEPGMAEALAAATWGDPAPEGGEDESASARSAGEGRSGKAQRDRRLVRWTERLLGKGSRHRLPTQLGH